MILAVDTSCYTTSMIVVATEDGRILFEQNKLLTVKPGERGLRQSEGFFQHVHNLTEAYDALSKKIDPRKLKAVAVSSRPRPVEGSYMPVFHSGLLFSLNIANTLGIPLFQTSHQEGHLMAAIRTCGLKEAPARFTGLHLSGGTTEILSVITKVDGFEVEMLGGSLDLNFGQLIDRIGVGLGMAFPCGREMDGLASEVQHHDSFKVKLKQELSFNLSGFENKYREMIGTASPAWICRHVFNTISDLLKQLIMNMPAGQPVILSGGVASNQLIQSQIGAHFSGKSIYYALPEYARDNAYGTAELGRKAFWLAQEVSHA